MVFRNKRFKSSGNFGGGDTKSVQIRTLENPFDTSNGQPKWPDGIPTYSIGRRHQATSEITMDEYMVALFPGSINWCVVVKPVDGKVQCWANHSTNISFCYQFSVREDTPAVQWEVGLDGFTSWRPVAYAMHCQLINTTDRNEGWYEAVRMPKNNLLTKWNVLGGTGSPLGNGNYILETPHFHTGGLMPGYELLNRLYNTSVWFNEPTYITGELQDLHNAIFQLNASTEQNEFKRLSAFAFMNDGYEQETLVQRDDDVPVSEMASYRPRTTVDEMDATHINKQFYNLPNNSAAEQLSGDCFDMILLKIHGTVGTKLLLHSCANQEFLTAENGQMAQYVTECDNNSAQLKSYNWVRNARFKYPFHYLASGGHLTVPRPPYI